VLTGNAAATNAGPAVAHSFVLSGVVSAFAGLCYAEMASSTCPIRSPVGIDATGLTWPKPLISRILFSMARDGLLPPWGAQIDRRFHTPYVSSLLIGAAVTVLAGTLPIGLVAELVSIGTLLAFAIVCIGVLVLRNTQPNLERPFKALAIFLVGCALGLRADAGTARDHLDAAGDLDGDRACDLFPLQRGPQPGAHPPLSRATRRRSPS
jgi:Amino acid permease